MYAHYELLELMYNKLAYRFSVCLDLTFMYVYWYLIILNILNRKNFYTPDRAGKNHDFFYLNQLFLFKSNISINIL